MKRKDWKIKKSKKDIYGKYFKRRRIFFLRKLFIRKNLVLFKKNLIPNFFFYGNLLKNFNKQKFFYLKKTFLLNNIKSSTVVPNFFFKKKIFGLENDFLKFIQENKLIYIFIKNINTDKNNFFGVNGLILDIKGDNISKILDKDENKIIVVEKKQTLLFKIAEFNNFFNFYLNYNLYFMVIIELYKINILLYLNKLK